MRYLATFLISLLVEIWDVFNPPAGMDDSFREAAVLSAKSDVLARFVRWESVFRLRNQPKKAEDGGEIAPVYCSADFYFCHGCPGAVNMMMT